mgnify:CR=1 FL=1
MSVILEQMASNLVQAEDGLWVSRDHSAVSYPAEGMDFTYRLEEHSYWFQHRNRCILSLAKRFYPSGAFFDIGGGNGFVSQALRTVGIESVVVEPDPSGSRHALARGLTPVIAATLDDAGFYAQSLPAVGLFDVLEHIQDDHALLLQLHHLLAADGQLFLTVPAYTWLWSIYDDAAGHFRRYRLGALEALLRSTGFEINFATYIFGFLPPAVFLLRSLPYHLRLRRSVDLSEDDDAAEYTVDNALLNRVLDFELGQINALRPLIMGGSCLVAARKV